MTSVKCFGSWLKEAGRGHLTRCLDGQQFFIYTVLLVMRLSLDTSYTFFGIGNTVLLWLSMGLGVLFLFWSSFICCSRSKQEFLLQSSGVKKGMIFWSRYTHGVIHFFLPFLLMISVCGIWQAMVDPEFAPFVGSYTAKSILAFGFAFFNLLSYRDFMCFGMRQFYMCSLTLCFDHCVFFFIY